MSDGAYSLPANYVLCVDTARQFVESRVGQAERSVRALDLMTGSVNCLSRWTSEAKETMEEEQMSKLSKDIGDMWLILGQGLRKVCLDQREEVRNHALLSLQKCLTGADDIYLPYGKWLDCFDLVIFTVLDDLLEISQGHSQKDYRNMEGTLILAVKLLSKVFLQSLPILSQLTTFCKLWLGVLTTTQCSATTPHGSPLRSSRPSLRLNRTPSSPIVNNTSPHCQTVSSLRTEQLPFTVPLSP